MYACRQGQVTARTSGQEVDAAERSRSCGRFAPKAPRRLAALTGVNPPDSATTMTEVPAQPHSRIVIAGGSGFIGSALAIHFVARGHDVAILTRSASAREDGVREVAWNGRTVGDWARELDGAAAIINVTGRSINVRHTEKHRREIISSRVDSVRSIGDAIRGSATPAPVWVQASAGGFYGNAGDALCDESAPHGHDFMAQVCKDWE